MSAAIRLFTLGFTRKNARTFFETLKGAGVGQLLDIRLNNTSQMAGFTKRDDLAYFTETILGGPYLHLPLLAPSEAILSRYREDKNWQRYEADFLALMHARQVAGMFAPVQLDKGCLLCSEPVADFCHRRLVAEHLQACWGNVDIVHL